MRRWAVISLVALAVLLVATQLLLPGYLEGRIEDRLTARGGTAEVALTSRPAVRLLAGDADRIEATGQNLTVDLTEPRPEVFDRLEGFDEVDVRLTDVTAGPFRVSGLGLSREGGSPGYGLRLTATVSPQELAGFAGSEVAGPLGGIFGGIVGDAAPFGDAPIPIDLETRIEETDGEWMSAGGADTIAGVPAGPVAEALASAIVAQL